MDFGHLLLVTEETQRRRRRREETYIVRRHLRERNNPMDLEDSDFMRLFRISREIAFVVIESISGDIRRIRSNGLPVHVVVLTAVRFYAVGSYQRCIGQEYNLALGQRTVSKVVKEVSEAIVRRLLPVYIRFPSTAAERALIADGFLQKHGVPDCLGCIDCTHVAIVTPYNNDPNDPPVSYKNRKGNYTINTQFVCDSNCRLINVNARFPGSTHDQHIFNNSAVKDEMARLTNNRVGRFYLIGDSGYAKEPYMITPILPSPPEGSSGSVYNHKISKMRNCVERTNGIIKAIFRCLKKDRVLHYQPKRAAFIILSCCTIYNMMHHFRYPLREIDIQDPVGDDIEDPVEPVGTGSSRALQRQYEICEIINNLQ